MTLAPAKINLGLHVLRRRGDGYRDIRTVFIPIPWADRIGANEAESISLSSSDRSLPTDDRNLCIRAAQLLYERVKPGLGAHITLDKHIPYGAGLGGGSSDAAATLLLLNDLWDLALPRETLAELAAELGSDVPFFLSGVPAVGEGRGERLTPLLDADGAGYVFPFNLCVVVPPVEVSTPEAYEMIVPRADRGVSSGRELLEDVVLSNDLERWRNELVNDFQEPVFSRFPVIQAAHQMLLDAGAGYASLSGSGSAVFGVFEEEAAYVAAGEAARSQGFRVWAGPLSQ